MFWQVASCVSAPLCRSLACTYVVCDLCSDVSLSLFSFFFFFVVCGKFLLLKDAVRFCESALKFRQARKGVIVAYCAKVSCRCGLCTFFTDNCTDSSMQGTKLTILRQF